MLNLQQKSLRKGCFKSIVKSICYHDVGNRCMMINKKPIFIVCFARGGSNILLNLLLSHPDVCVPRGETQQVFQGGGQSFYIRIVKLLRYSPILILEKSNIMSAHKWELRSPFSPFTRKQIDRILYYDKMKALKLGQNLYKTEGIKNTLDEIKNARILCKNINGLIFLSNEFYAMYPDGTFIALLRNGLAVCEGHIRRGEDLVRIATNYEKGCQQIIYDFQHIPNYHIIRYEDIIANPTETLKKIYNLCKLDFALVKKIRLQTKKVIDKTGKHQFVHNKKSKQTIWYKPNNFMQHFIKDVNETQINRLSDKDKTTILQICKNSLQYFDYI